jgi:hypothetical protein
MLAFATMLGLVGSLLLPCGGEHAHHGGERTIGPAHAVQRPGARVPGRAGARAQLHAARLRAAGGKFEYLRVVNFQNIMSLCELCRKEAKDVKCAH